MKRRGKKFSVVIQSDNKDIFFKTRIEANTFEHLQSAMETDEPFAKADYVFYNRNSRKRFEIKALEFDPARPFDCPIDFEMVRDAIE